MPVLGVIRGLVFFCSPVSAGDRRFYIRPGTHRREVRAVGLVPDNPPVRGCLSSRQWGGIQNGPWAREADSRQPPRIPQEVPLGGTVHRLPLWDDATLPRSFGSWSPSFLSIPNSLPLRIQIAGANLLHVDSYTPPATQLPPRCAFPANRPGQ